MRSDPRLRPLALVLALVPLSIPPGAIAQEIPRALEHEDTYRWSAIEDRTLSADGVWLAYVLAPWDGDPTLVLTRFDGTAERRFRGRDPVFTRDSRHLAFRVPPVEAVVDSLQLEGADEDDLPGDTLAVVDLDAAFAGDGSPQAGVFREGPIESFMVPEDGGSWLAYRLAEPPGDEDEDEGVDEEEEEPGEEEEEEERSATWEVAHEKEDGTTLVFRDLAGGADRRFELVLEYAVAPGGDALAFAVSSEEGDGDGLHVVDPESREATRVLAGSGHYTRLAFDESGARLAFVTDRDTWTAERPEPVLYLARGEDWAAARVADADTGGMPPGWWVSPYGALAFSDDGSRLFFGTAPRPDPEPEEVLDEDEVRVDVWNWHDAYLQPMQLVQAEEERTRSYLAVAREGAEEIVQLGSVDIPDVARTRTGEGAFVLGSTDVPYRQELSWDGRYADAWAIDIRSGERRAIASRVRGFGGARLSPAGRFAYWWDDEERDWKVAPMDGSTPAASLTAAIPHAFHDELDDHPQGPPPYGTPEWLEGDGAVLAYDRFDVWRIDPRGRVAPIRLTGGREAGVRYRVVDLDPDEPALPEGPLLYSTFDLERRASGFARGPADGAAATRTLIEDDVWYGAPRKARDADALVWTRETFVEFPDLWVGGPGFADARRVSDANPQQSEYRWGSARIVSWMSGDRTPLEGILITPDGFDPGERYPMMVYFYERLSDDLHRYQAPVPNRASIRYAFYASRGYLVFIPDIPYEVGYPGESALDAVVPGVLSLIDEGFVDPDRIGVQGHSWGGYQIAYMITKTGVFAAAEAGAPVANMTSAYGGIRWSSGMSRMFQYERTQSRIGGSLWDATMEYLHNSPLFYADKIRTPLLMMHNDEDGAVPWYQGIELFVALRRLGKPVYLLNYNGEDHGLVRRANQEDWAVRMQQFFDHHLMDALAPEWMARGVPAVVKGRDRGLGLVEAPAAEEEGGGGSPR